MRVAADTRKKVAEFAAAIESRYINAAVNGCIKAGIKNPEGIPEAVKALQNIQTALAQWHKQEPRVPGGHCLEEVKHNIVDAALEALGCADHDDALNGNSKPQ